MNNILLTIRKDVFLSISYRVFTIQTTILIFFFFFFHFFIFLMRPESVHKWFTSGYIFLYFEDDVNRSIHKPLENKGRKPFSCIFSCRITKL